MVSLKTNTGKGFLNIFQHNEGGMVSRPCTFTTITSWDPDINTIYDYYPFGAPMPGRNLALAPCSTYVSNDTMQVLYEDGTTPENWTPFPDGTTVENESDQLKVTGSGTADDPWGITQNFDQINGILYTVYFCYDNGTCGSERLWVKIKNPSGSTIVTSGHYDTDGCYTFTFTANETGAGSIEFYMEDADCKFYLDDIKITYAYQTVNTGCDGGTDSYMFGFNGREKLSEMYGEGNAYSFDFRLYDPRTCRWFSLDPLMKNFPMWSPYLAIANNPIYFTDPDGREPIRTYAGTLSNMMSHLRTENVNTLTKLRKYFGSDQIGRDNGNKNPNRYLYSKKWGWIDMKHITFAADVASTWHHTSYTTLNEGEALEQRQEKKIWPNDRKESTNSAWDYEDLVSNLLGVGFEDYLKSDAAKGKDILTNLETYFTELGFTENPTEAPNWNPSEIVPDEYEVPNSEYQPNTKDVNYTYDPMFAPDMDKRTTDVDKRVLKIQKNQETNVWHGGKNRRTARGGMGEN